jgi:methionyl-tRNA formyltransferase
LIIPQEALKNCRQTLNIHPSLLPFGRGSDPVVWTVANEWPAGATLHAMTAELDAGPIWAQREVSYAFPCTGGQLYGRVLDACLDLFRDEWPSIHQGLRDPRDQIDLEFEPIRRQALWEARDRRLNSPEAVTPREVLRFLLALDFGESMAARYEVDGHLYRVSLDVRAERLSEDPEGSQRPGAVHDE